MYVTDDFATTLSLHEVPHPWLYEEGQWRIILAVRGFPDASADYSVVCFILLLQPMYYCGSFLGKSVHDLRIEDVIRYFEQPQTESDIIEYKAFVERGVKKALREAEDAVLRTICAFLNSSGGLLIWGAPVESQGKDGVKVYQGGLTSVPTKYEKDQLINKIINRIAPMPTGIRTSDPLQHGKGYVYVIDVAESNHKPHQLDGCYWMRNDGQTNKAPHHYVEAMFRRVSFPNLNGEITLKTSAGRNNVGDPCYTIAIEVRVENLSPYQNELNPKVTLYKNSDIMPLEKRRKHSALHYGDPLLISTIYRRDSPGNGKTHSHEFMVAFGGDKSPLKFTRHRITITGTTFIKRVGQTVSGENTCEFHEEMLFQNKFAHHIDEHYLPL